MKSSVPSSVKRPNFGFIETAMFTRIHSKWLPTRSKVPSTRKSFWQILSTKYLSFLVVISSSLYVTPAESRTVADCQSQVSSTLDIFYFYFFTCPSSSNIPPRYVNDPPPLCRPWRWLQFLLSLANKNEKFFFYRVEKERRKKNSWNRFTAIAIVRVGHLWNRRWPDSRENHQYGWMVSSCGRLFLSPCVKLARVSCGFLLRVWLVTPNRSKDLWTDLRENQIAKLTEEN